MSTRTQALSRSTPNQWARSAINVSLRTQTQALNRSMLNKWARSAINVLQGYSTNVFEVYMLQVKVNRRYYNSYDS